MLQQAREHKEFSRTKKKKAEYPKLDTMAKFIVLLFNGFHGRKRLVFVAGVLWVFFPRKVSPILSLFFFFKY